MNCNNCIEYTVLENLSYGSHERQKLDLFIPRIKKSDRGVILFIHPCAWIAGDKEIYRRSAEDFCRSGYITATTNYRYLNEKISAFEQTDDIIASMEQIKRTLAERGIRVDKVMLSGGSAGAHLAMLTAYAFASKCPLKPVAVVDHCGPADINDHDFFYNSIFMGGQTDRIAEHLSMLCGFRFTPETYDDAMLYRKAVSPISYVTPGVPPTILAYGALDDCVRQCVADALAGALEAAGVRHDYVIYPNSGHEIDKDPDCAKKVHELFEAYAHDYLDD